MRVALLCLMIVGCGESAEQAYQRGFEDGTKQGRIEERAATFEQIKSIMDKGIGENPEITLETEMMKKDTRDAVEKVRKLLDQN